MTGRNLLKTMDHGKRFTNELTTLTALNGKSPSPSQNPICKSNITSQSGAPNAAWAHNSLQDAEHYAAELGKKFDCSSTVSYAFFQKVGGIVNCQDIGNEILFSSKSKRTGA